MHLNISHPILIRPLQSITRTTAGIFTLLILLTTACSKKEPAGPSTSNMGPQMPETSDNTIPAAPTTEKIKFKKPGGTTAFSLKFKIDGLKLVDGNEQEIARINFTENGKYKAKDSADKVLAYVTGNAPKFQIKDATQKETLFTLQKQEDGDWKLEGSEEKLICKIGKRDYGWKIEDGAEKQLGKVKTEDGRISIRDQNDEELFYTNDPLPSMTAVPFALPQLSQPQAAALSAALSKSTQ